MFLIIFFALAILSYVLLIYLVPILLRKNEPFHPPPGPKGLPIIGNLHQFDALQPQVYFAKLAKIYGPIVSLRLGHIPVVVVQSANLAKEVIKTQDLNFCGRPPMVALRKLSYNCIDITFCPYNDYYREIKKLAIVHLFNTKRVESFAPIRQEEVSRMIEHISSLSSASEVVNLSELLIRYACSHICKVAFGKRYDDDDTGSKSKFHNLINEAETIFTTFFYSDYLPYIGWLDYLTGQFSRLEKIFKDLNAFYEEIIDDHLQPLNKPTSDREDIIDVLLNVKSERPFQFTLDHIKAVLMDIFLGGTGTSSSTVIWAMTELVKNPNSMKKVQEELRSASKNKGYIDKEDLMDLFYFKAVVKETFRLHPPVPLLIVHETIRKSTIEEFNIQPKTSVYVNAWAIGRDPQFWMDPENFMPERFIGSSIDFKGNDFELIPFGAGRRLCPGINLGVAAVELALANLLYSFDWELPKGLTKEDIDTDMHPGVVTHKKNPLCLLAR